MALFANTTAADFKKGDIIMFAMGSICPDRCLGGQFACAPICYGVFSTIVDVTNGCLGGGCGVCFGDEKGFHVGINIKLP
jgi:hypothetical protein